MNARHADEGEPAGGPGDPDRALTGAEDVSRAVHFIAIGGVGMSGLATICAQLGFRVSGSDRADSERLRRLRELGVDARAGHDAEAVPPEAEVVVSSAIGDDNPELARARERGQRVVHRADMLAELCARRRLIAVSGAHGKTTTAGMLAHALRAAGADPSFALGGELPGGDGGSGSANAAWASGDWIVAEADESDGSFLKLSPEVAVVTNVELDHHANWSGEGELLEAFRRFTAGGAVVRPAEQRLAALEGTAGPLRFAVVAGGGAGGDEAELLASDLEPVEGGTEFTLRVPGEEPRRARLSIPGRHNVANALAAIGAVVAARRLDPGLPPLADVVEALAGFPGMGRRLELKGRRNGALIYDDYAHHPTEVAASLAALRELPHRRLIAVFQPHLYSRTRALASRFGRALAAADEVGVLDVYAAREVPEGELAGISGLRVAEATADAAPGRRVRWLPDAERAAAALAAELGPGDLLVTLGAGDVYRLAEALADPG